MTEQTDNQTAFSWPPLESNAAAFNAYMHSIGVAETAKFHEATMFEPVVLCGDDLYPLPENCVGCVAAIQRKNPDGKPGSAENVEDTKFYMKQSGTLDNACGIIAILHAVLNNLDQIELKDESLLNKLNEVFTAKTPEQRAKTMETYTPLKQAHQAAAQNGQTAMPTEQSQVETHFIAFVKNKKSEIVELDGRKTGPVVLGSGDLVEGSVAEIMRRSKEDMIGWKMNVMFLCTN